MTSLDSFFMWWCIAWVLVFAWWCAYRSLLWLLDRFGPPEPPPALLGHTLMRIGLNGITPGVCQETAGDTRETA